MRKYDMISGLAEYTAKDVVRKEKRGTTHGILCTSYLVYQLFYFVHIFFIDVVGIVNSFAIWLRLELIRPSSVLYFIDISIQNELV